MGHIENSQNDLALSFVDFDIRSKILEYKLAWLDTSAYIFDLTDRMQDEILAVDDQMIKYLDLLVELKGTVLWLNYVTSRKKYYGIKERSQRYQQKLAEVVQKRTRLFGGNSVFGGKDNEDPGVMLENCIMQNRSADELKASIENLKGVWDATKGNIHNDMNYCIQLAGGLRHKYKDVTNKEKISWKCCKKS